MFQIISFKEDGLANLALIKLCEDDSVRLLRSLNPDAEDGVQGEEFGEEWTLSDRGAAAAAFLNNGFWKTWTDINGTACGGILRGRGASVHGDERPPVCGLQRRV